MKRALILSFVFFFFIVYTLAQSFPVTDTHTTVSHIAGSKQLQYLNIGLIAISILSIILLAILLLLIRKNRALRRIVSIKQKELEDNNNRNRYALETVECNLKDKDILIKKVIRDKEAALKEKAEQQQELEQLKAAHPPLTDTKDIETDDVGWKQKYEESRQMLKRYKELTESDDDFHHKLQELELNMLKIEKLNSLFADQAITAEEYEQKRKKLLDEL
jgi:hypothetical protein